MQNLNLCRIKYASGEYAQALRLRDQVLRRPLNMSIDHDDLTGETADIHLGAFCGNELVAVLSLTELDDHSVKMRQVAVKPDWQGRGVGRALVKFAERIAAGQGYEQIRLHARKTALTFYQKCGYTAVGNEFIEVTIPHCAMFKSIAKLLSEH